MSNNRNILSQLVTRNCLFSFLMGNACAQSIIFPVSKKSSLIHSSRLSMPQLHQLETPPQEIPQNHSQWRFRPVGSPSEWIEEYRPGGYHPVELGDVFENKYKVVRKLGYGSYSTVWLARDTSWV